MDTGDKKVLGVGQQRTHVQLASGPAYYVFIAPDEALTQPKSIEDSAESYQPGNNLGPVGPCPKPFCPHHAIVFRTRQTQKQIAKWHAMMKPIPGATPKQFYCDKCQHYSIKFIAPTKNGQWGHCFNGYSHYEKTLQMYGHTTYVYL